MDFMGFMELLRYATMPIALGLGVYAVIALRPHRLGLLLGASILLLISYVGVPLPLDFGGSLTPWLKHTPVYIGVLGLALFLSLFARSNRQTQKKLEKTATTMVAAAVVGHAGRAPLTGWLGLLSDEGLHHIVVIPLFVVVLVATIALSADAPLWLRKSLKFFMYGVMALTLSHVMEFIVFGQGFLPFLHGPQFDVVEVGLAYTMLFWTFLGIRSGRAAFVA